MSEQRYVGCQVSFIEFENISIHFGPVQLEQINLAFVGSEPDR